MKTLPMLNSRERWCCALGCGFCEAKPALVEYSRTEHDNGDVESKSRRVYVSSCCEADILLWNEDVQDVIEWSNVESDKTDAVSVESCGDFLGAEVRQQIALLAHMPDSFIQPEFRFPAGIDALSLFKECRAAAEIWAPLKPYVLQFDEFMNCKSCFGQGTIILQSDEGDFPDDFSAEHVACPECALLASARS